MLLTNSSTEPGRVREYFDSRGWDGETRSHAEIAEVFTPDTGWKRHAGRKRVSRDRLLAAQAAGVTSVSLRVRYSDRRPVTADFSVKELLEGEA